MKKLFALLLLAPLATFAQNKHALIISIADYPAESGWAVISSDKDIDLVKPVYEKQGFSDIMVIQDKQATREGIVAAMGKMTAACKPGDIALVHYSGHGQQIFDDNNDEPDGLDEALVAYGAPSEYQDGYKGQKHMRDDEFGQLLYDMRLKLGKTGSMLVVVDACHSGTSSRGVAKKRGGKAPIVPPGYKPGGSGEKGPGYNTGEIKTRGQSAAGVAPMVLFAASSFDEENSETLDDKGNGIGSLSYAMAKSLSKCGKDYSYRSLFADVSAIMTEKVPQQTPMIEGEQDVALFGGQYLKQQPYFLIKEIKNGLPVLAAGSLMGASVDTKIAIYPAGTLSAGKSEPLVKGEITKAGPYSSSVKLEKPFNFSQPSAYWVFITQPGLGNISLNYKIGVIKNPEVQKQLSFELSKIEALKLNPSAPDILILEEADHIKVVRATDGFVIDSAIAGSDALYSSLISGLRVYAQNKYLRDLHTGFANNVQLQLLPCDENGALINKSIPEGLADIKVGSHLKVKVVNKSSQRVYFNVIDIQPDGKINAIAPAIQELSLKHAEQYYVDANSAREIPFTIEILPPYGNEMFKVFASNEPFNLTPFIASNGMQSRGAGGSLIGALRGTSEVSSRGASGKKQEVQELMTGELVFRIVK